MLINLIISRICKPVSAFESEIQSWSNQSVENILLYTRHPIHLTKETKVLTWVTIILMWCKFHSVCVASWNIRHIKRHTYKLAGTCFATGYENWNLFLAPNFNRMMNSESLPWSNRILNLHDLPFIITTFSKLDYQAF